MQSKPRLLESVNYSRSCEYLLLSPRVELREVCLVYHHMCLFLKRVDLVVELKFELMETVTFSGAMCEME